METPLLGWSLFFNKVVHDSFFIEHLQTVASERLMIGNNNECLIALRYLYFVFFLQSCFYCRNLLIDKDYLKCKIPTINE